MARWYRHIRPDPPAAPENLRRILRIVRSTAATLAVVLAAGACAGASKVHVSAGSDPTGDDVPAESPTTTSTTTTTAPVAGGAPSDERTLTKVETITEGELSPKSVVASGEGLFFAQNMIYNHNVGVYDRDLNLVSTVDDSVELSAWGIDAPPGTVTGGPVEAAFTSDGAYAYVSNYEMEGPGYSNPGADKCSPGDWDNSFVYRIDTSSLEIDQVVEVGPVPKFVAVTPDDSKVLVTNWCGYDMSVIDVATGAEVTKIPIGRYPRGIAVSPDSSTAYVAAMGTTDIAVVDLADNTIHWIEGVGSGPRHLVMSPDGSTLYATLNGADQVAKIDVATETVVATVSSPSQPRSMEIAADGRSLYVVNYDSDQMSKIRTSDMVEIQREPTGHHPIGITVDHATSRVWVANYAGSLSVFEDS